MTEPIITIRLNGNGRVYCPGESLSGEYRIAAVPSEDIKAVEVSVLWSSEGKGDSDMAVHYFRRLSADDAEAPDLSQPGHFHTVLPNSPLSYEGAIVKLRWSVRVRTFLGNGKEWFAEKPFRLGAVPPAKAEPT